MIKRIRNKGCLPYLAAEGEFLKPIPGVKGNVDRKGANWYEGLSPFDRCFTHQTLSSARRFAHFKPFSGLVPQDSLDFLISSPFDQSKETFPEKGDPCLQAETMGINTWRRLRNSRDLKPERDAKGSELSFEGVLGSSTGLKLVRYNNSHPVLIGGITEREHPSHVKLMNSSHHSPQTNAGYTRQESYGTIFRY